MDRKVTLVTPKNSDRYCNHERLQRSNARNGRNQNIHPYEIYKSIWVFINTVTTVTYLYEYVYKKEKTMTWLSNRCGNVSPFGRYQWLLGCFPPFSARSEGLPHA